MSLGGSMKRPLFFFFAPVLLLAACGPAESASPGECGDGHVDVPESCDEGADNGLPGHCKADCSGKPALANVSGDVLAFAGEVGGARVAGAKVWVLENPDKSVVTGPDAHFEIDGLDVGSEVTLVMEHPDYHPTQTATFVLGEHGIHPFTIQAVSTVLFNALSGIVPNPPQEDKACSIATTVTRSGGSLYVHLRQGEPGTTVTLIPAAPAESGPIYFNEDVIPDVKQTSTSIDGGVVFANVPPGDYTLHGSKPGLVFQPVKLKCRVGQLVNAGPPLGVLAHVVDPDLAGGDSYPDDAYSEATGALCEKTASCVNAKSPGNYPPANVASCKAMFANALSFVDPLCDADAAFRGAWKALFECRAQSCDLALGGDEACPDEDAAFAAAMELYGACYAKSHAP
jgi:hypothetical protein